MVFALGYVSVLSNTQIEKVANLIKDNDRFADQIPFATGAFGEVFTYSSDGFVKMHKIVDADVEIIASGTKFLFQNFNDEDFQNTYFDMQLYKEAIKKCGPLSVNDCFIFEPIPALGGDKRLESITVGDKYSYIALVLSIE